MKGLMPAKCSRHLLCFLVVCCVLHNRHNPNSHPLSQCPHFLYLDLWLVSVPFSICMNTKYLKSRDFWGGGTVVSKIQLELHSVAQVDSEFLIYFLVSLYFVCLFVCLAVWVIKMLANDRGGKRLLCHCGLYICRVTALHIHLVWAQISVLVPLTPPKALVSLFRWCSALAWVCHWN